MLRLSNGRLAALCISLSLFSGCSTPPAHNTEDDADDDDASEDSDTKDSDPSDSDDDDGDDDESNDDDETPSEETIDPGARCEDTEIGPRVLRRLTRDELANTLNSIFPEYEGMWGGVLLALDSVESKQKFNNDHTLRFGKQATQDLLATAEDLASTVSANLERSMSCATSSPDAACAAEVIDTYGYRLYRRPLSSTEHDRYLELYESVAKDSDFRMGVKWVLVSLLQSPYAVYRHELGTSADDDTFELTPYELATALAYTFSGTAPTQELLDAAGRGELDDADALRRHAEKLLASADGHEVMRSFFRDWLDYERVVAKTKTNIADFVWIRDLMVEEADAFLDTLIFEENGSVQDLLTADYTMVNDQLAQYYGLAVQGKSGFYRAQRDEGIGLLTLGAFLASRSKSDSSSPTQRGLALYERLLCNEPPPPPQGEIPEIEPPEPGVHTTRERYETLHAQEPCSTCHVVFDPLGFAFEHFDEGGRYRADEFGLPIEPHGVAYDGKRELFTFSDQADQAQKMADEPVVLDCVSGQLAAYAFGGVAECLAEESARDAFNAGDLSIREFMAELAASPHFRERKSE